MRIVQQNHQILLILLVNLSYVKDALSYKLSHCVVQVGKYLFTPEDVVRMKHVDAGNEAVNDRYLAVYDESKEILSPPTIESIKSDRQSWLVRKYKNKSWYKIPFVASGTKACVSTKNFKDQEDNNSQSGTELSRGSHDSQETRLTSLKTNAYGYPTLKENKAGIRSTKNDRKSERSHLQGLSNERKPMCTSCNRESNDNSSHVSREPTQLYTMKYPNLTELHRYTLTADIQNDTSTISSEELSVSTNASSIPSIYRPAGNKKINTHLQRRKVSFLKQSRRRINNQYAIDGNNFSSNGRANASDLAQITTPRLPGFTSS